GVMPLGPKMVARRTPARPFGASPGHNRPKALLIDRPTGLLTPVNVAVTASGLLFPLRNGPLCELNSWTRPSSVEACPPDAAKRGGMANGRPPRGSMDSRAPSSQSGLAFGAPQFDA